MRTLYVIGLVGLVACGRSSISELSNGEPDPSDTIVDEPIPDDDEEPVPLRCDINAASFTWSAPQVATDVRDLMLTVATNAGWSAWDPVLSEDGLALYLSSDAEFSWSVYELTRPSLTAPFDTIRSVLEELNLGNVTTFGYQPLASTHLALATGAYALPDNPTNETVFALGDSSDANGITWTTPPVAQTYAGKISDARLSASGLTAIFAVSNSSTRDLLMSTRLSLGDFFTSSGPVLPPLGGDNSAPWLSADERTLIFAHADGPTPHIWIARRASTSVAFETAEPLASVNSNVFDGEPYVFVNGPACELYMVSNRDSAFRIYRALQDSPVR